MTLGFASDVLEKAGILVDSCLYGRENEEWHGAAIDSRKDCTGRLFFAFLGEKTNGHRFIAQAVLQGSKGLVVQTDEGVRESEKMTVPFLQVKEILAALQKLAGAFRKTLSARVIAITGSSGKTGTKELVRAALGSEHLVHCNPGNYNNHIGVPLTILDTRSDSEYLISEVGANHKGEIAFLSDMLEPDVAVITNIGNAHIGYFGSRKKIAEAKAELLEKIPASGYAILPGDDDFIRFLKKRAKCRVVTFGLSPRCDFRVKNYEFDGGGSAFYVNDKRMTLKMMGVHNALNAAAAVALSSAEGVAWEQALSAISKAEPLPGRGKLYRGKGVVIIDDAYNANPASMEAAIEVLDRFEAKRKKAVFGDMGELGELSESYHVELGERLAKMRCDEIYWFGEAGAFVEIGAKRAGGNCSIRRFSDMDRLIGAVECDLQPGDVVLVKGSHVCGLDAVVSSLTALLGSSGRD
jgi:UDP-N-acetylmuramoyl-tripeptide--D-alanyl-D-alanine ligase